MHSDLIRPMRLTQKIPALKGPIKEASQYFGPTTAVADTRVFDLLNRRSKPFLLEWINGDRLALPRAEQDRWRTQWFEVVDEMMAVAAFVAYGRQAFILSDPIIAALSNTDLTGVSSSDLRCPYPAFYIHIDRSAVIDDGAHLLDGAYVQLLPSCIQVRLCTLPRDMPPWAIEPAFTVNITRDKTGSLESVVEEEIAALHSRSPMLRAQLESALSDCGTADFAFVAECLSQERRAKEIDNAREFVRKSLSLVCNALCLLTAIPEGDLGPKVTFPAPKQARPGTAHKAQKGAVEARFVNLGQNHDACASPKGASNNGPRAHWRRGHWRRQAVGSRSDPCHVLRWIRPTLIARARGAVAENSFYTFGGG